MKIASKLMLCGGLYSWICFLSADFIAGIIYNEFAVSVQSSLKSLYVAGFIGFVVFIIGLVLFSREK